jgi:hypothetical protein
MARKRSLGDITLRQMNDAYEVTLQRCMENSDGRTHMPCAQGGLYFKRIARRKYELIETSRQVTDVSKRAIRLCSMSFKGKLKIACQSGVFTMRSFMSEMMP